MSRTPIRLLVLALTAAIAAFVLPAPAQAAPYCGITWGSLTKQAGNSAPSLRGSELTAVRAGQHPCYDRLVLDVTGNNRLASYRVAYVPAVRADGSGAVVSLRGGAFLQITVGVDNRLAPPASSGDVVNVNGFRTFRQVAAAGGFEGYTSDGLGVRARLPFRVFPVSGPGSTARLVIDVAHAWEA
jgi:hypothetical protein